jgi:hypothetical protein
MPLAMIDEYAPDDAKDADTSALYDVPRIAAILRAIAAEGRWVSYSELLMSLGFRFTRPKMRVVCKTLDTVDSEAALRGEPELAVLVVRESDGLPGQGWWVCRTDYEGQWTGAEARDFVRQLQNQTFAYWQKREGR